MEGKQISCQQAVSDQWRGDGRADWRPLILENGPTDAGAQLERETNGAGRKGPSGPSLRPSGLGPNRWAGENAGCELVEGCESRGRAPHSVSGLRRTVIVISHWSWPICYLLWRPLVPVSARRWPLFGRPKRR